ncbi:MAG: tRNA glutamyl-Q(34) synthetase GluQRS [Alphaproteobacteria bacterium]|nr:MAG: tRNA glutamyl-Q(34) synthetase GluQRS [Alphaproteobacteria bacterium]
MRRIREGNDGFVTRFAPSPTGRLHLGHAFSALLAHDAAQRAGGRFLLRIEDIDRARCREEFVAAILEDLAWLGIAWEEPVRRQSAHFADYRAAIARLREAGLVYPCVCTRKEIAAEVAAAGAAPHGAGKSPYPGTCRRDRARAKRRIADGGPFAWRLDCAAALARLESIGRWPLFFTEEGEGDVPVDPALIGDVVLARKDTPTSYHLSVVVDDALQDISHVIRGADLREATHVHRLLQALLDLPSPRYRHHRLILGRDGRRLAKRDRSATLQQLRAAGVTPAEIRAELGLA